MNTKLQVVLWGETISEHDTYEEAVIEAERLERDTGCPYQVRGTDEMTLKYKHIAIDWDGTIVEDGAYPDAGIFKPHVVKVLKRIWDECGEIVIWTCRNGDEQIATIEKKLASVGIFDYKINQPFDHFTNIYGGDNARKIFADVYIDDRAIGAVIDWYEIERQLFGEI